VALADPDARAATLQAYLDEQGLGRDARKIYRHMDAGSVDLRAAYEHQFLNRIVRIRRRLGLPTPEPPARRWYRASDADVRSWSVGGRRVQRSWMVQR
jgi:hypothetical protein